MKKFSIKPKRIDLTNTTNLFDYIILTSIVGVGIFLSIFAFVTAIHYRHEDALQEFRYNAGHLHSLVAAKAAKYDLQMEVLTKFTATNRSISSAKQLKWLRMRVEDTQFSCVSLLRVDPRTNLLWQEKMVKHKGHCRLFDRTNQVVESAEIKAGSDGALTVNRVIKLDESGETYLSLALPQDALKPNAAESKDMIVEVTALTDLAPVKSDSEFHFDHTVSVMGQDLNVSYHPIVFARDMQLGWTWMVLLVGGVITSLVGAIVFSLINRNIAISKEVDKKTLDLREATERAIHANETKSRFLANVSHEVRTPLNLILGMAEVLSETPITPEQKNYVETFRRAGNHLLELVNDVLDVASIEAGEVPYEERDMSLVELVENVADFVSVACRLKKLSFDYEIDPSIPSLVRGDSKRLRQVLINLINNSLKYTDRGGITLRLGLKKDAGAQRIIFEVSDTGIGIAQSELDKIFGEFYQVDSSSTRARVGVGLGLSIVKTYIEHLRGAINVDSELGAGTRFTVSLELKPCGAETWLDELRTYFAGTKSRIMIVSPNTVQTRFMRNILEKMGYEVGVLESGRAAIKQLGKGRAKDVHYIIDLVGKDFGGLEVLQALHLTHEEISRTTVLCPIVHRIDDPECLRRLEIESICYAPVKMRALAQALKPSADRSNERVAKPTVVTNIQHGLRVLIAEDDEDNRFLLQTYMGALDIEVSFTNDGRAALERYRDLAPEIDLLITDIQMPRMDGFELIKEVRDFESIQGLQTVPIVALTADAQPDQVLRVKTLGGNGYLTKPIGKSELMNLLRQYSFNAKAS